MGLNLFSNKSKKTEEQDTDVLLKENIFLNFSQRAFHFRWFMLFASGK